MTLSEKGIKTALAIAFLVCSACASAARNPALGSYPAGVNGHTTVIYYDIHGRTLQELRADMRRLGPSVEGHSFFGATRSPMRWRWTLEPTGTAYCTLRDVTVTVNAEITLPRWTPPDDVDADLTTEWNRFLGALEKHEGGHKDISAKAAREILSRLRGLSDLCSMINSRANEIARAIVERARVEQQQYDASTGHGLTQGTGFGAGRSLPANN